ncbi:hypothetical protein KCU95_g3733, partial [Aureobasidium melanogenum]
MAPASFSSLPPELVSKICSDTGLKKKDLIALRLTSKVQGIHASATKAFGKLCFTVVPLVYTRYSLETFVKICGHPIFGPCVREVKLSCMRFDSHDFGSFVKIMVEWGYPRERLLNEVQLLAARCDEEDLFYTSDAKVLLERAFAHLSESDHSLTIVISPDEYEALGASRIFGSEERDEYFYADVPFTLNLLLGSAKRAGCRVPKLNIAVAARRFSHDSDYDLSYLMHSISELKLELTFVDQYGDGEPRGFIRWIRDLLSQGTSIKSLKLCLMIFDNDDNRKIQPFFQIISRLPLEVLSLQCLYISQKAMADLLESLGSILRRLDIGCCNVVGSWVQVLVSIQQNCSQLDYLQIFNSGKAWLRPWKAYEGTTAVRSGLEERLKAEQDAAEDSAESDDE